MAGGAAGLGGIKYVSLAEPSGYGVAGRRLMRALVRHGVPVTWMPMVGGHREPPYYRPFHGPALGDADLDPICNRDIAYDTVILHTVPEYYPGLIAAEQGRGIVGHTVWETTAIPAHWPELLNRVDRLIVPCSWNKDVFARDGVTVPIDVVPHVADTDASADAYVERGLTAAEDGYVFYTIGVWTERKSPWRTVEAFCEAFTSADAVTLVIKTTPRDQTVTGPLRYFGRSVENAVARVTRRYRRPPRIRVLTGVWSDAEIRALHLQGDCYVSLCRGEGWGLGAFDAAAHGKPVVMTGFGGQLEYLDRELAYLCDYALVPVVNPQAPQSYSPDQRWAEPDVQHGAALLRHVFAHADEARQRARVLQADVQARFGEEAVVARLAAALAGAAT